MAKRITKSARHVAAATSSWTLGLAGSDAQHRVLDHLSPTEVCNECYSETTILDAEIESLAA